MHFFLSRTLTFFQDSASARPSFGWFTHPLSKGSEGQLKGSEVLPEGSEGLTEGSEGLSEGPEGLSEQFESLPERP